MWYTILVATTLYILSACCKFWVIHPSNKFVFSFLSKPHHFHCQHFWQDLITSISVKTNVTRTNLISLSTWTILLWILKKLRGVLEFQKFDLKHSYSLFSWLTKIFSAEEHYVLSRLPFFMILSYSLRDHWKTELRLDLHLTFLFYRVKEPLKI